MQTLSHSDTYSDISNSRYIGRDAITLDLTSNIGAIKYITDLADKHCLDIGCGDGQFAEVLHHQRADVWGVDVNSASIERFNERLPDSTRKGWLASATKLPFDNRFFDLSIMFNSFHHVPEEGITAALDEAMRVTMPTGCFLILEPDAQGSYFELVKQVDDETFVRRQAREYLQKWVKAGGFSAKVYRYQQEVSFTSFDQFLDRLLMADPARKEMIETKRIELQSLFQTGWKSEKDRFCFTQPRTLFCIRH